MKLHLHRTAHLNTITSYGPDWIAVNGVSYTHSILVQPEGPVLPWPVAQGLNLQANHFAPLLSLHPEVVLLGTGERQFFAPPNALAAFHERRIGVETMTTGAACRTYNILMAEGRRVLAALIGAMP